MYCEMNPHGVAVYTNELFPKGVYLTYMLASNYEIEVFFPSTFEAERRLRVSLQEITGTELCSFYFNQYKSETT